MVRRKGNAVGRVHEPAELPFPPGPDHEFQRRRAPNWPATTPRRPNTRFLLHFYLFDKSNECRNNKWVKVPAAWPRLSKNGVSSASITRLFLIGSNSTAAEGPKLAPPAHVPRTSTTKFKDGNRLLFFRQGCTSRRGYGSINAIDAPPRATAQSDLRSLFCMSPPVRLPNGCTRPQGQPVPHCSDQQGSFRRAF